MDKKIYKFSYGGKLKKIFAKLINLFFNTLIGTFLAFVTMFVLGKVNVYLESIVSDSIILTRIELGIAISEILFFAVISLFPQKVVIKGDIIKVYRYNLSEFCRGFNDKMKIANIESIEKVPKTSFLNLPVFDAYVRIVDWNDFIKITMSTGVLLHYISVENSDDFINEVKKRQSMIENNHTFEAKASPNMFQFDLQRGYMPDCDEIVLGVNGVEFKTDKATADLINVKSISYNDIQLCKKSDKHSINGVDSDNIVEITTATQTYYIPIKNPYDFINELYKKLNSCNR